MKKIKRRLEQFLFYDYAGIEDHLNKMAEKGWKLHKVSPFYWEYRKIEPQNLTYTVTYFSEASEFNPYPTENQQIFHDYCNNAGWDLVTEWAQMQIFCTTHKDTITIETEEAVKLKAIHKAMKKNFIPSIIILLLLAVFQMIFSLHWIIINPVSELSNKITFYNMIMWIIILTQSLITLTSYATWYFKSKKSINIGEPCTKSNPIYRYIYSFITLLILITASLSIFSLSPRLVGWVCLWIVANIGILFPLINTIKKALKRTGASRRVNLSISIISAVVLSSAMTFIMGMGLIKGLDAGWFGNKPYATYTNNSLGYAHTWDIYYDELPLKVEDLQSVNYDHYSYKWTQRNTLLLNYSTGVQKSYPDEQDPPRLNYDIVKVKIPILFNLCLKEYLAMYNYDFPVLEEDKKHFLKIDAAIWQADTVYQLFTQEKKESEYILCWDNKIIYINFPTIPTEDQILIAIEKLGKE